MGYNPKGLSEKEILSVVNYSPSNGMRDKDSIFITHHGYIMEGDSCEKIS